MTDLDLSGAWTPEMYAEHLPEAIAFDPGLICAAIETCQPKEVLDLGCGLGYFVKFLREQNVQAWGIEEAEMGRFFKAPGYQIQQNLSQPFNLNKTYDLVICLEVVEHIPNAFEDVVFDNIVRHMGHYLLFSGAIPGQQGTGHINEQPESYWFAHLVRRGLRLVHSASTEVRLKSQLPWYAQNASIWELESQQDCSFLVAERDSMILQDRIKIQRLHQQAQRDRFELAELQMQLKSLQAEREILNRTAAQAHVEIAAMKTSKFWKLRSQWFRLKNLFGVSSDAKS